MSATGPARLTLVSHGMTDAMSAGLFARDEPLNALGRRQLDALGELRADRAVCGPELRARQSAQQLGLPATAEPALADLDAGGWRGRSAEDLQPAELIAWLTDPDAAPPGGESITVLTERVGGWLAAPVPGRTVAVTHPAVIRAAVLVALNAPAVSFWRIDVRPGGATVLHHRGTGWTLRT